MKNKNLIQLVAITVGACLWAGCSVYDHTRRVETDFYGGVVSYTDRTSLYTLFKKGDADLIQSRTVETTNGYIREVGVHKLTASGDSTSIEASGGAAGTLAGEAAKAFLAPH